MCFFQIEITAIRGTGWRSDTAIDSVHLTNGECSDKLEEDNKIAAYVIDLSDGVAMCPKHFIGVDCSYVSKYLKYTHPDTVATFALIFCVSRQSLNPVYSDGCFHTC